MENIHSIQNQDLVDFLQRQCKKLINISNCVVCKFGVEEVPQSPVFK